MVSEKIKEINDTLDMFPTSLMTLEYLVDLGKKAVKEFPEEDRTEVNFIHGCTSSAWIKLLNNDPDWSANSITAVFVGEDGFEEENLNDLANQSGTYTGAQDERRRTIADDQIEYINSKYDLFN